MRYEMQILRFYLGRQHYSHDLYLHLRDDLNDHSNNIVLYHFVFDKIGLIVSCYFTMRYIFLLSIVYPYFNNNTMILNNIISSRQSHNKKKS